MATRSQPRRAGGATVALALGAAGGCIAALLLLFAAGVDVARLTRDPAAGGPLGAGAVSLLGSLAWAAGATVLAFAGAQIAARDGWSSATVRLLLGSAAFTALLCLDDTLVLHERTRSFGDAGALLVLAFYLAAVTAWLALAGALADRRHRPVLLAAIGLLAASLSVDTTVDLLDATSDAGALAVEDALKAGGIAAWTVWAVAVAWTRAGGRPGADLPSA